MMPSERIYRALHHFSLFLTLSFQLNSLNHYYMKASQPACRAGPVGVKRAGPETGLARFHVIKPFAFAMLTLLGGLAAVYRVSPARE